MLRLQVLQASQMQKKVYLRLINLKRDNEDKRKDFLA